MAFSALPSSGAGSATAGRVVRASWGEQVRLNFDDHEDRIGDLEVTLGSTWRGAWSEQTSYNAGDLVQHNGSTWRASAAIVAASPPDEPGDVSPTSWELFAGAGESDAQFVTLAATDSLDNERVLTGSGRISVTDGGAGSTVTLDVPDGGITYAKIQDVSAASTLLGRGAGGGSGDVQEITLGAGLTMTGTTISSGAGGVGTSVVTRKAATETVNNSAVFQDDDHFSFAILANEVYLVELTLLLESASTASDYKFQWTVPAGGSYYIAPNNVGATVIGSVVWQWDPMITGVTPTTLSTTISAIGSAAAGVCGCYLRSIIINAGTGGTVNFQWAQNSATVADSKVLINSCMIRTQLA